MKKMCNFATFISVFLLVVLVVGCSSLPDPTEEKKTLLYGIVQFNYKNFEGNASFAANHVAYNGVKVQFKEIDTDKILTMISGTDGVFYRVGLNPGKYQLVKIEYKLEAGNAWMKVWFPADQNDARTMFEVVEKGVTNLGVLDWNYDFEARQQWYYWKNGYDKASSIFQEHFPESNWLLEDWFNK